MNVRLVFCLQTLQVLSSVLVVGCNFYLNISDCLLVSMESNTSSVCFRSEFSDIFDLEHFKRVLAHDVRVVSSLPSTHLMSRPVEEKRTPLHVSPRWIRSRYLRRVSPFTIWSYHISTVFGCKEEKICKFKQKWESRVHISSWTHNLCHL